MQTNQDREQRLREEANEQRTTALPDPATASGAGLLRGTVRYDEKSETWYLGNVNLTPYLARCRDQEVMVVVARLEPIETGKEPRLLCESCGCALDELGDCPHCQLHFVQTAYRHRERVRRETLFAEIDQIVQERWTT